MEELAARFPTASGPQEDILNQVARELLLLQSSDWPFLVTTGQAKEYASQRFTEHVDRFESLAISAERGDELTVEDTEMLAALRERDNPFSAIDYRSFGERQGRAGLNVR